MLDPPPPLVYHKSKGRKNNSSQNLIVLDTSLSQNLVNFDGRSSHFLIF